jgi:hypothetical protein
MFAIAEYIFDGIQSDWLTGDFDFSFFKAGHMGAFDPYAGFAGQV